MLLATRDICLFPFGRVCFSTSTLAVPFYVFHINIYVYHNDVCMEQESVGLYAVLKDEGGVVQGVCDRLVR